MHRDQDLYHLPSPPITFAHGIRTRELSDLLTKGILQWETGQVSGGLLKVPDTCSVTRMVGSAVAGGILGITGFAAGIPIGIGTVSFGLIVGGGKSILSVCYGSAQCE